jgi:hypothetical protein
MTSIRTSLARIGFGAIGSIAIAGGSGANGFEASHDAVGAGRTKFVLSQDYPTDRAAAAEGETSPWLAFDIKAEARDYLFAVLRYVIEGNEDIFAPGPDALDRPWQVEVAGKTRWYHVPWMHYGVFGREGLHGLTRERSPRLSELLAPEERPAQDKKFQAWAVSFYNPLGGYAIGRVWPKEGLPEPNAASFPQGTVVAKLLFVEATEEHVSYLKGAPSWRALVHQTPDDCSVVPSDNRTSCDRVEAKVQLLQLDVAVKDDRSEDTGWVFGTFVFNGHRRPDEAGAIVSGSRLVEHASIWNQLEPVGLMWGNGIEETKLTLDDRSTYQHLGCDGRLNGPVDNPAASCMACHALARFPVPVPDNFPMRFPACGEVTEEGGIPTTISAAYFRNLAGDEVIDDVRAINVPKADQLPKVTNLKDLKALEYSLQLSFGLINYCNFWGEADREPSREIAEFCGLEPSQIGSSQVIVAPQAAPAPQAPDAKGEWFPKMAVQVR